MAEEVPTDTPEQAKDGPISPSQQRTFEIVTQILKLKSRLGEIKTLIRLLIERGDKYEMVIKKLEEEVKDISDGQIVFELKEE